MQNRNQRLIGLIAVAMLFTTIISVSASQKSYSQRQLTINGAGATFPFPLIDTWRVAYLKVHPNVNINYQSIGSGEGVKQFAAKTVDFGASDTPLTAEERQEVPGVVQIPETIGSVVVAYNIPEIPTKMLKLTAIFYAFNTRSFESVAFVESSNSFTSSWFVVCLNTTVSAAAVADTRLTFLSAIGIEQ